MVVVTVLCGANTAGHTCITCIAWYEGTHLRDCSSEHGLFSALTGVGWRTSAVAGTAIIKVAVSSFSSALPLGCGGYLPVP